MNTPFSSDEVPLTDREEMPRSQHEALRVPYTRPSLKPLALVDTSGTNAGGGDLEAGS